MPTESDFKTTVLEILENNHPGKGSEIFNGSRIIRYLTIKTKAANSGSKSRASFGNLYAIYVLTEDYLNKGFHNTEGYAKYEGAQFKRLLSRTRELPFGSKIQNHALNHRLNQEFHKYNEDIEERPIIRDAQTQRYWINEQLLKYQNINLAGSVCEIIDAYVAARKSSFNSFINTAEKLTGASTIEAEDKIDFVKSLLGPKKDARIFEIASFAILKQWYSNDSVYFGKTLQDLEEHQLSLYKTGRTNANDGGIDFVMKPLGRFFQVTETTDVKKYFLDIDKLEKFPITFVVKSTKSVDDLMSEITRRAKEQYTIEAIVNRYISCVEEIINLPSLHKMVDEMGAKGQIGEILEEIVTQSKVEFNLEHDT